MKWERKHSLPGERVRQLVFVHRDHRHVHNLMIVMLLLIPLMVMMYMCTETTDMMMVIMDRCTTMLFVQ